MLPPQAARDPEFYQKQNLPMPTLRVVREDDDGVVISGMKMLATGAVFADEIWIGNVLPLAPDQKKEAITCAIPCNAPGLQLWSRKPLAAELHVGIRFAALLRFDESDACCCATRSRCRGSASSSTTTRCCRATSIIKTPSHSFGNHQSNVRYWSKMQLLVGLCSQIADATGADEVPAVRETLGRMAALRSDDRRHGQRSDQRLRGLAGGHGYVCFNRRMMYAALNWCTRITRCSSTSCASSAAAACSRCRPTSR